MNLEKEIKIVEKEFRKELEKKPSIIGSNEIDCKIIQGVYNNFLKEKYVDKWREKGTIIGLKNPLLIDHVMMNFGYKYDYSLKSSKECFKKTE